MCVAHTTGEPSIISSGQDAPHKRYQNARLLGNGCHLVVADILLGLPVSCLFGSAFVSCRAIAPTTDKHFSISHVYLLRILVSSFRSTYFFTRRRGESHTYHFTRLEGTPATHEAARGTDHRWAQAFQRLIYQPYSTKTGTNIYI